MKLNLNLLKKQADQAEPAISTDPAANATRGKIIDAALETFARKGYHDTKMDEIADESGTSKGAIYFHFPSKEKLFLGLVNEFANLLERRVIEAIEIAPQGMERVEIALSTCLQTFEKYRRYAKVLLVQAVGLGVAFEEARTLVNDRFARLIGRYLQEAIDQRQIAPVDVEVISLAWMGAIYALIIRWVTTNEPAPDKILQALVPALLRSVGYNKTSDK